MFDPQTILLATVVILAAFVVKGMTGFARRWWRCFGDGARLT